MDFPSAGQLIRHYNAFLISGPLVLAVSVGFWISWIRSLRKPPVAGTSGGRHRLLPFALATLLIGSVHFLGIYASVANAIRFRFDPKDATELRIVRATEEGRVVDEPPRTISDRALIAEGLSRLALSESRRRNHEHFLEGYRIQIIVPGSTTERYVSVYRKSSGGGSVTVTVPHLGAGHAGTMSNAGEYSCPGFHDWVARNVDPLFAGR